MAGASILPKLALVFLYASSRRVTVIHRAEAPVHRRIPVHLLALISHRFADREASAASTCISHAGQLVAVMVTCDATGAA